MQIDTQKTVEQTLAKYQWSDLENWQKTTDGKSDIFSREVYRKNNLTILQRKWPEGQGISVETPDYTLFISTGYHLNQFNTKKQTKYYSLDIATTMSEKKVYQSILDEAGFQNIKGDRVYLFHFMENLPDCYFDLVVDPKAKHISTFWMNPRRSFIYSKNHAVNMGKGQRS